MSKLSDLPAELVARTFYFLPNQDLLQARFLSKQLERSLFPLFGRRFFTERGFMITKAGLLALRCIAEHPRLRTYVQHIWFNLDSFAIARAELGAAEEDFGKYMIEVLINYILMQGVLVSPNSDDGFGLSNPAHREYMTERYERMKVVNLSNSLEKAFSRFPNLTVVGMKGEVVERDPRVPLPDLNQFRFDQLSDATKLFLAIINAVAATDVKLKRLYTEAIQLDNIRPDLLAQPLLNQVFKSVHDLEFTYTQDRVITAQGSEHCNIENSPFHGEALTKVLMASTNLKKIDITFFFLPTTNVIERQWVPHLELAHLTHIKLSSFTTTPEALFGFLPSTLISVEMQCIGLTGSPECWRTILTYFQKSCPDLDYLFVNAAMYAGGLFSFQGSHVGPMKLGPGKISWDLLGRTPFTLEACGKDNAKSKLSDALDKLWHIDSTSKMCVLP